MCGKGGQMNLFLFILILIDFTRNQATESADFERNSTALATQTFEAIEKFKIDLPRRLHLFRMLSRFSTQSSSRLTPSETSHNAVNSKAIIYNKRSIIRPKIRGGQNADVHAW